MGLCAETRVTRPLEVQMSLLDDVVQKTKSTRAEKAEQDRLETHAQALVDRYADLRVAPEQVNIERGHRKWHGDPRVTVAGIGVGQLLEFTGCGPEFDGRWSVVKVETHETRAIVASRTGGPPYARMLEEDVRAEIREGRLHLLRGA